MSADKSPRHNDIAIGALLELAQTNPDAKKVLLKYSHESSHGSNSKNIEMCRIPELKNAAAFLKLKVRDDKGDKLYTKKKMCSSIDWT